MSADFLTRLAARALNRAPVVRPRLPSLFELGPETGGPAAEPGLEPASEPEAPRAFFAPPASVAPAAFAPEPVAREVTGDAPAAVAPAAISAQGGMRAPRSGGEETPVRSRRESIPPAVGSGQQAEPARSVQPGRPGAPAAGLRPASGPVKDRSPASRLAADADSSPETRRSGQAVPAAAVLEAPAPAAAASTLRPSIEIEARSAAAVPELRPGPRAMPGRRGQLGVRPAAPPAEAAAADAEHVVQVTIGRIDVRAVHPRPAPARARREPAQPRVSLEEYLRRRREGRR